MDASPYINANLLATRQNLPDAGGLVESWLNQLEAIRAMDLSEPDIEPAVCFDLLALWAKLRRVRPELISELEGEAELDWAGSFLKDRRQEVARRGLSFPNAQGWLEEAEELNAAYDQPDHPDTIRELAETLVTDLDDAELMLCATRELGQEHADLEKLLRTCRDWLMEHAEQFYACTVLVQALGMTVRPDLPDFDYDLAWTASKFEWLLHEAEKIEWESSMQWVEPPNLEMTKIESLQRLGRMQKIRRDAVTFALAAGEEREPASSECVQWRAPSRRYVAKMFLVPQDNEFIIHFLDSDGNLATGLSGQIVSFDGVPARIDERGQATITAKQMNGAASEEFLLLVENERWELVMP